MTVVCINDSDKPNEIPIGKWIKKDNIYTVIDIQKLLSSHQLGYVLEEITLDESCFPYFYFDARRFAMCDEIVINELMEEIKEIFEEQPETV